MVSRQRDPCLRNNDLHILHILNRKASQSARDSATARSSSEATFPTHTTPIQIYVQIIAIVRIGNLLLKVVVGKLKLQTLELQICVRRHLPAGPMSSQKEVNRPAIKLFVQEHQGHQNPKGVHQCQFLIPIQVHQLAEEAGPPKGALRQAIGTHRPVRPPLMKIVKAGGILKIVGKLNPPHPPAGPMSPQMRVRIVLQGQMIHQHVETIGTEIGEESAKLTT